MRSFGPLALFLAASGLAAGPAWAMPRADAPQPILLAQADEASQYQRGPAGAQSLNAAVVNALDLLGYRAGPPRDEMDRTLHAAIKAFQRDQGLPASGRVSKRLVSALAAELNRRHVSLSANAPAVRPGALRAVGNGTGIVVDAVGHVLTNHHVVRQCAEMRAGNGERLDPVAIDPAADLALLKLRLAHPAYATFRDGNNARPGEPVVVLGFPLHGFLGADVIVTTGAINALAGYRNDRSEMQISAPTQPGNSGGPVLDSSGNLVGVVVARLEAANLRTKNAIIPENVNFAINEATVRRFLDAQHVRYRTAPSGAALAAPDVAAKGTPFTLLLECWAAHPLARE